MRKLKIILHSNSLYIFLLLFICIYLFLFTKVIQYDTKIPEDCKEITAKLWSFSIDGDKLSMILKAEEKIKATYYIQNETEKTELETQLQIGQTLKLEGNKRKNIGLTIPNTFDYKKYLTYEKIYFSFEVSKIEILDKKILWFDRIKNIINTRLKNLGNHPYLRAFVIGDKTYLEEEQYEMIKNNGVSHLFALSGMHLSFIYKILNQILSKIKGKKIIIYVLLFEYLLITGFSISFLRAILFMIFLDINKKMKLHISKRKILFLTAFLILIFRPFSIYNVGFWYTFVVTFSLVYCSSFIEKQNKISQIIFVSGITFFFSLPITIYLNYEINLMSILNNIILIPIVTVLVFPSALFSFLFPFLIPFFNFAIFLLEKINYLLNFFSLSLVFGKITILEIFIYYIFLILIIEMQSKKGIVLLILFLAFLYNKNLLQLNYNVYFLDVGQGDSTLFVSPQNKEVILIDTGGNITYSKKEYQKRRKNYNLANSIVIFLKSIRIRKINLLVITHGDQDHIGYANDIGKNIKIEKIMINEGKITEKEKQLLENYSQIKKYNSHYFDFKTLNFKVYNSENDNSIITKIKILNQTFLLMGDASVKVEEELLAKENVSAIFLKLGHHGSNTSSSLSFLQKVNPTHAIVSAGRNNLYHHPSKETIDKLKKLNISILNTQEAGTIRIVIDKKKYHIIKTLT